MKKHILFIITLLCVFNSYADVYHPNQKPNPKYKNIKVYAEVLERLGDSDFYLIQIDIENIGDSTTLSSGICNNH